MWIWRLHKKTSVWLFGCRRERKSVRFVNEFHKIHVIERNSSEGFQQFGREKRKLTRIQTTSRSNHIWPDALTRIGTAAQRTGNRCSKMTGAEVKQNSFVLILPGKDGILCSIAIWYTNSFKWKDLEEISSLNFLLFFLVKAGACCLVLRRGVSVGTKFLE